MISEKIEYIEQIIKNNSSVKDRIFNCVACGYEIQYHKIIGGYVGLVKYMPRKKIKIIQIGWRVDKSVCVVL